MKKFTKVFVIICLLMLFVLAAVACSTTGTLGKDKEGRFKLAAPKVEINNNTLTWKEVRYCKEYGVKIDDQEEIVVPKTSYTLIIEEQKEVTVKVRALGDDKETVSSPYSKEVKYKSNGRLADPQAPTISEEGDNWVISWNAIANAKNYWIRQESSIKNKTADYYSDTNSLSISKSEFSTPDIYNFKVQALNTIESGFLNSNFSEASHKYVETTLATPVPKYIDDGSKDIGKITWDKITETGISVRYRIWMLKEGDTDYIEVKTQSSNNIYKSDYSSFVKNYTKITMNIIDDEDINDEDLVGEYTIKIQAVSDSYPKIYKESEKAIVNSQSSGEPKVIKKPAAVQNIQFVADSENGDKLTWDKLNDYERYTVVYKSNETKLRDITNSDTSSNLVESLKENHAGKVANISICVAEDSKEGILQGVETWWMQDEKKGEYCYIQNEAPETIQEGKFEGYMKVEDLGDLTYMLKNAQDGEKYVLMTKDNKGINANSINIYGGEGVFNALFDGNNQIINRLNIIKDSNAGTGSKLSMFGTIGASGKVQNLILNEVEIKNEDLQNVAFVANANDGVIDKVNILGATLETKGNVAGFVNENRGSILSCGLLNTSILGAGDVAGVATINSGKIFNASIVQAQIVSETVDKLCRAGGIVAINEAAGSIENSFVFNRKDYSSSKRESKIVAKSSVSVQEEVAIAGGLVAVNRGAISSSYVSGESLKKYIEASVDYYVEEKNRATVGEISRISYAGGLVGVSEGGSITSCYVSKVIINASTLAGYAGGLVGFKDDASTISISNCFVFNLGISAKTTAKIVKGANVTATSVYCVENMGDNTASSENATNIVTRAELIDVQLEGFTAVKSEYPEYPILTDMIYVKNNIYSISSTFDGDLGVYLGGNASTKLEPIVKNDKLQLYQATTASEKTLVLPIFFA